MDLATRMGRVSKSSRTATAAVLPYSPCYSLSSPSRLIVPFLSTVHPLSGWNATLPRAYDAEVRLNFGSRWQQLSMEDSCRLSGQVHDKDTLKRCWYKIAFRNAVLGACMWYVGHRSLLLVTCNCYCSYKALFITHFFHWFYDYPRYFIFSSLFCYSIFIVAK